MYASAVRRVIVAVSILVAFAGGCGKGRGKTHRGPPPAPQPAEQKPTPEGRAKRFVEQLRDRHYATARASFGPALTAAVSEPNLIAAWTDVLTRAGRFERFERVTVDAEKDGVRVVHVHTEHALVGMDIRVVFDGQDRIVGLWFDPRPGPWTAPPYIRPLAFAAHPVELAGLPSTLTVPVASGRAPALVLVHGSGPHDRDGSVGGRKPFRDLAEGLATRGVVALRWEKRTKVAPATLPPPFDLDGEFTRDVRAAVDVLSKRPEVDPKRIFVLGHGQGASMAPRIAQQEPRIAGLVLVAGATRPYEEVLVDQQRYLLGLAGTSGAVLEGRLRALHDECALSREKKGDAADLLSVAGSKAPRQYWQDLFGYDPTVPAKALSIPVLVIQGGRDHEVTATDFEGWTKALGGKKGVVLRFHPRLDHHLVIGEGPSRPDEYGWPGHVAGEVVADIAAFVLGTLGS